MKKLLRYAGLGLALLLGTTQAYGQERLGIGTASPDTTLHVIGGIRIVDLQQADGELLRSDSEGIGTWRDPLTVKTDTQALILDANRDTRLWIEASPNDDKIRFRIGGTEYMTMHNGRIEMHNTGRSVYIGVNTGQTDDFDNRANVGIGPEVLDRMTTGRWNTAIGDKTLQQLETGVGNVAFGFATMSQNGATQYCTNYGRLSSSGSVAEYCTGIGHWVLATPFNTTALGADVDALDSNTVIFPLFARVGIGTSTPDESLHVEGTIEVDNTIQAHDPDGLAFATDDGITRLQITDSGNIDIGSLSDPGALTINDASRTALILRTDNNNIDLGLALQDDDADYSWKINRSLSTGTHAHLIFAGGQAAANVDALAERMRIFNNGQVAIANTAGVTGYHLSVGGKAIAEGLMVRDIGTWPDYVFSDDYPLMPIDELRGFVYQNGHLPNVPDAREVAKSGIEVGATQRRIVEKIEELTLYILDLDARLNEVAENQEAVRSTLKMQRP